jgi:hypothetical protein
LSTKPGQAQLTESPRYTHMLIHEVEAYRSAAIPLLARYARRGHEEAKARLATFVGDVNDPRRANRGTYANALSFYPRHCEELTCQGFFGELLAGLLVELYSPHAIDWQIPAFCFYAHDLLFQELLIAAAAGTMPRRAMGHFGDDCLAFSLTSDQTAVHKILICEAKCTTDHSSSLIADAHAKISTQPIEATTIWLQTMIDSLLTRGDAHSRYWVPILRSFKDSPDFSEQNRRDLVSYSHGRRRARVGKTWISTGQRHVNYEARRELAVLEVHLNEVRSLVADTYAAAFP